ncbi:TrlF family AAA-like ATPase [Porphyromonas gingivalis]|uniref:TrlF family AAA-like ATPase n=1 Tax=Porphyromonas gingivalis TaxID=837 RepID=UPI001F3EBF8A|nr:DNA repair protein [Porphyromonas gingivalis]MCE8164633.1 DNA repair protein [Porphyromonas gingivalis]MCE8179940.1 DNA repair protein [Porphyromonas gingivalis]
MNKGSEWRIWDLHFHTPSSYDYKDRSVTNQDIINALSKNNVSVVAITDHHVIDIERIQDLQRLGKEKNIVVLPGIEFCSELGGSEAIHYIGIFPETVNLDTIWTKIQGQCNLTSEEITLKGQERVFCPFEKTSHLIIELGGLVTIHAGKKSNSIEGIKNNLLVKQEFKQQLLSTYHPLLEIGKIEDIESYRSHVFPSINFSLPIILCSDNHNIREYTTKEKLWIKADTTFEGLKQILFEPEERVRIQTSKPDEKDIYKVIDSIRLNENGFWMGEIPLNSNLNTIIGGRSTGKSSLLKAIAAKHGSTNVPEKDFIRNHLEGVSIQWQDGDSTTGHEIEYFPQSYMHKIASDPEETNRLVKDIIRSKKEGELLSTYKTDTEDISKRIRGNIYTLFKDQDDISSIKKDLLEKGNKAGVEEQLKQLESKALELQKNSVMAVEERKLFQEQTRQVLEKRKLIADAEHDLSLLTKLLEDIPFVSSFIDKYPSIKLSFSTNQNDIEQSFNALKQQYADEWKRSVCGLIEMTQSQKEKLSSDIQSIENEVSYKKWLRIVEDNKELRDVNNKINEEKRKLDDISKLEEQKTQITNHQEKVLQKVVDDHCSYKDKANGVCNALKIFHGELGISVTADFHFLEMQDFLQSKLNQRGRERQNYVQGLLQEYKNNNKINILNFLKELLSEDVILKNWNNPKDVAIDFFTRNWYGLNFCLSYQEDDFTQMSEGKQAFVILKLLLDFSDKKCPILIDQPEDSLDNRAIYNELVTYIKEKKKERQVILVTHNSNVVVSADAENIIIANQKGVDTPNLGGVKFQYINGALEDTKQRDENTECILSSQGIREHICDILEGGRIAFEKREQKYGFRR